MTGRRSDQERLGLAHARALAATLDLDPSTLSEGDPLPLGWHWVWFNEAARRSELGEDGHERRGEFLPDLGLPRRMWAGGRLRFHDPLRIGERVRRDSTVGAVQRKEGRSGRLAFVTVHHVLQGEDGRTAVEEEQDLVYLEGRTAGADRGQSDPGPSGGPRGPGAEPAPSAAREPSDWSEPFAADEVTLFRFSALTFNGHRIHYDRRWATDVEGYPDLVVHGPLLALLLLGGGLRHAPTPATAGTRFSYRASQPLFCGESFSVVGRRTESREALWALELRAEHPVRGVAMRATLAADSSAASGA